MVVVHGLVKSVSRARLHQPLCIILHYCLCKSESPKVRTGAD